MTSTPVPAQSAGQPRAAKPPLTIVLAAPRGFCAGVDRAVQIVELALQRFGPPVYVRHEIVHNRTVVENLRTKGAIFVNELDEIPDTGAPVIFSAHGVPKSVPAEATRRNLFYLDATCPLVSKVHIEVARRHAEGREILLIGHAGHPEVIGTIGQLAQGTVKLIETVEAAENFTPAPRYLSDLGQQGPADPNRLAYVTQTTLSVDDTRAIVDVLQHRFPMISGPAKDDICYATSNRQEAVKAIASRVDALMVVGAPNSSNSMRLVEVAKKAGCALAFLVQDTGEIPWDRLPNLRNLGLTAGASAPEHLIQEIIAAFSRCYEVTVETVTMATENVTFKLPRVLTSCAS